MYTDSCTVYFYWLSATVLYSAYSQQVLGRLTMTALWLENRSLKQNALVKTHTVHELNL